jgi:hypothetical protein
MFTLKIKNKEDYRENIDWEIIYEKDPKKNKLVGCGVFWKSTKLFVKTVVDKIHKMRIVNGYGIQDDAIKELEKKRCKKVVIQNDFGERYWSDFSRWLEVKPREFSGHGKQRFLDRDKDMVKTKAK